MNVLLAKVSSLGDIVHTLPALADAARHGARFDWVVEEDFQPVAALGAGVQRVLPVAFSPLAGLPGQGPARAAHLPAPSPPASLRPCA